MTRRLHAVALVPDGDLSTRLDGLRRALGDTRREDLPSHLTLVPPIDLEPERAAALQGVLRNAAARVSPFVLELGPAASFAPRTPTLHLEVGGDLDELVELRDALRVAPLDRPDVHDFVPHVTLLQRCDRELVPAAVALLGDVVGSWDVRSVVLLERLRPASGAVWHPVAEEPLGGPRVVGRGGVELHLRAVSVLEPAVAELAGGELAARRGAGDPLPAGGGLLVAVAEPPGGPGAPVGAAWGRASAGGAVLEHVVVRGDRRREGVARQLVSHWCDAAAARGAAAVLAAPAADPVATGAMAALGFLAAGEHTLLRRVGPLGELGSA